MRRLISLVIISLSFLFACTPETTLKTSEPSSTPRAAPRASWEEEWDKLKKEGKKEGWVVIYSTLGSDTRDLLTKAFKEKYGVSLEFISGRGAEAALKLATERRAGIYNADIWLGGVGSAITLLKPQKAFDKLEPALILPEVADPKK